MRSNLTGIFIAVSFVLVPPVASAQTPFRSITSTIGPLTQIALGVEGSDQIHHINNSVGQLYPPSTIPGDSGTLLYVVENHTLFAPAFSMHGGTATQNIGTNTPFTPLTQTTTVGSGTLMDPYRIVTTYAAGTTGLTLTQTDSYVSGQESYTSEVQIASTATVVKNVVLYRAGDCYLNGSDSGFGLADVSSHGVACSVAANNMPAGLVEQWLPISPDSHYYEANYSEVWLFIGTHQPFPDTCRCAEQIDNGAGLSWSIAISPGMTVTRSHLTTFAATGTLPVTTLKTADTATVSAGASDGYTITFTNPNMTPVTISTIVDQLPSGFVYQVGSSTGLTTTDPTVSSSDLTWSGTFVVPSMQSAMLHFTVTTTTSTGTFFNRVSAMANGNTAVSPTGDTAPIHITPAARMDGGVADTGAAGSDSGLMSGDGGGGGGGDGGMVSGDGGGGGGDGGMVSDDTGGSGVDGGMAGEDAAEMQQDAAESPDAAGGGGTDATASTGDDAGGTGGGRDGGTHDGSGATGDGGVNKSSSGCGCSTTSSERSNANGAWLAWGVFAFVLIPLRRRRKR